jgi:hypothetical protein
VNEREGVVFVPNEIDRFHHKIVIVAEITPTQAELTGYRGRDDGFCGRDDYNPVRLGN